MKLSFRSQQPPSEAAEVTDLDVTPVMNMFVILIPFLVSMAVFAHVSIIEFSLPPNVGPSMATSDLKPKPRLTVRIGKDYLGIVLGENLLDSIAINNLNFPFDSLATQIKLRHLEMETNDEVVVASRDNVPFKYVVKVMDLCRDAGFKKIGLSSATSDPGEAL